MARPGCPAHVSWVFAAPERRVVRSVQRRSPRRSGLGREVEIPPAQDRDPPTVPPSTAANRASRTVLQERILLNALSGVWRPSARSRSAAPDPSGIEATNPATTRRLHRRAIGVARFCADYLTATPRARKRAIATIRGRARGAVQPARAETRRRLHRRHVLLRLTTDRAIPLSVALVVLIAAGVSLAPAAAPVGAVQPEAPAPAGVRLTIGGGAGGPSEFDGPLTADAPVAEPIDDGTLYKPVAVDTTVASSVGKLRHYTVRSGDTLTAIANRFGVSMMTVWW